MNFKKLQEEIIKNAKKYSKKHKVKIDENFALLKLIEEIGELYQSILIHKKKCRPEKYVTNNISKRGIAKELADVIGISVVLANLLHINLEEALNKKWISKKWIK